VGAGGGAALSGPFPLHPHRHRTLRARTAATGPGGGRCRRDDVRVGASFPVLDEDRDGVRLLRAADSPGDHGACPSLACAPPRARPHFGLGYLSAPLGPPCPRSRSWPWHTSLVTHTRARTHTRTSQALSAHKNRLISSAPLGAGARPVPGARPGL
jgi:hypothetical protein